MPALRSRDVTSDDVAATPFCDTALRPYRGPLASLWLFGVLAVAIPVGLIIQVGVRGHHFQWSTREGPAGQPIWCTHWLGEHPTAQQLVAPSSPQPVLVAECEAKLPANWQRKGRQSQFFSLGPKQCFEASQQWLTALLAQGNKSNVSGPGIMGFAPDHEGLHGVFNTYFQPAAAPTPSTPNAPPCRGVQPLPQPATAVQSAPAAAPASQHQVRLRFELKVSPWTTQSRHSTCMLGGLLETVHLGAPYQRKSHPHSNMQIVRPSPSSAPAAAAPFTSTSSSARPGEVRCLISRVHKPVSGSL